MSFIIKTAKTVEEAIEAGLIELGIERDEADIEVLEEPKSGFLGLIGQKDAMVKIKEKDDITSFVRDILYDDDKEEKVKKKEPVEKVESSKKIEKKLEKKPKQKQNKQKREKREKVEKFETKKEKRETKKVEEKPEKVKEEVVKTETKEKTEDKPRKRKPLGEVWTDIEIKNNAEEFLSRILDEMDIQYGLITEIENNELKVEITSPKPSDLGIVIGKHGNTLDSLQYLLSQVVNKHTGEFVRVIVDANEYRDKRKRNLERIAKRSVDKAIKFRKPIKLEPMNPADRRIVHMALAHYENVETHSEGRDPYRRVVISVKGSRY